jgi:hypothetical protein
MSMDIGQIVDYIIEYDKIMDPDREQKEQEKVHKREATQADIDALLG